MMSMENPDYIIRICKELVGAISRVFELADKGGGIESILDTTEIQHFDHHIAVLARKCKLYEHPGPIGLNSKHLHVQEYTFGVGICPHSGEVVDFEWSIPDTLKKLQHEARIMVQREFKKKKAAREAANTPPCTEEEFRYFKSIHQGFCYLLDAKDYNSEYRVKQAEVFDQLEEFWPTLERICKHNKIDIDIDLSVCHIAIFGHESVEAPWSGEAELLANRAMEEEHLTRKTEAVFNRLMARLKRQFNDLFDDNSPEETNPPVEVNENIPELSDTVIPPERQSPPVSIQRMANCWGGDMTAKKLSGMIRSGRVKAKKLNRQTFIFDTKYLSPETIKQIKK